MHPIERLRYVARAGDPDPGLLAEEAAAALASLAFDERALVVACRRLLEAHPLAGPLWWVCAHVLAAQDPQLAAARVAGQLAADPTGEELAASLPASATVLAAPGALVSLALSLRADLEARLVGSPGALRFALSALGAGERATAFAPEHAAQAASGATVAVVEALAAGPSGVVVAPADAVVAAAASAAAVPLWVIAAEGRVLPAPLFEALAARVEAPGAAPADPRALGVLLRASGIAVLVGPAGPATPAAGLVGSGCPVPAELAAPRPRR